MKILLIILIVVISVPIVAVGALLVAHIVRSVRRAFRIHDPIEYYSGWDGYWHPISLSNKITKEEADVYATQGHAYLIGYFDTNGKKLIRVVKMLREPQFKARRGGGHESTQAFRCVLDLDELRRCHA
jgi:hypothetical protein